MSPPREEPLFKRLARSRALNSRNPSRDGSLSPSRAPFHDPNPRSASQPGKPSNVYVNQSTGGIVQYLPCTFVYPYTSSPSNTSLSLPSLNQPDTGDRIAQEEFQNNLPMRKLSKLSNLCWVSSVSQPDLTRTSNTPTQSPATSRASSPVPPSISARGSFSHIPSPNVSSLGSGASICMNKMPANGGSWNGSGNSLIHYDSVGNVSCSSSIHQASPYGSGNNLAWYGLSGSPYTSSQNVYLNGTDCGQGSGFGSSHFGIPTLNQPGLIQNLVYLPGEPTLPPSVNHQEGAASGQHRKNDHYHVLDPKLPQPVSMYRGNPTMSTIPPGVTFPVPPGTVNHGETNSNALKMAYRIPRRSVSPQKVANSEHRKPCAVIPPHTVLERSAEQPASPPTSRLVPTPVPPSSGPSWPPPDPEDKPAATVRAQVDPPKKDVGTSCSDLGTEESRYPFVVETCQICNLFSGTGGQKMTELTTTSRSTPFFSYSPCVYGHQVVLLNQEEEQGEAEKAENAPSPPTVVDSVKKDKQKLGRALLPKSASGAGQGTIDNRIEQAMDLVKSHLMSAVRSEVEELRDKITKLEESVTVLSRENEILRANVNPDILANLSSRGHPQIQAPPDPGQH